jgi:Cu(I)/Ag(I) efflux system protein CusF
MKLQKLLGATALAAVVFAGQPAFAQSNQDPVQAATPGLTDGEVRKIDRDAGKITLRHGEIQHMDMPPMTMVFVVRDKTLLDKTSVGAKVRFMATNENGQMTVTDIQPSK